MAPPSHPDGRATPDRQVSNSEGLQLSFDDIFERNQSTSAVDRTRSESLVGSPLHHSLSLAGSPFPATPDRTPPAHFDSVFTLSPQSFNMSLFELDGQSAFMPEPTPSGASSPMSTTSFTFSPARSVNTDNTYGAGTSFDTTLTIPSPTSPSFSSSSSAKGKQRAAAAASLTFTPFTPFEAEATSEESGSPRPSQVNGWHDSDESQVNHEEPGPSRSRSTNVILDRQDREASGIALTIGYGYSTQRADPPTAKSFSRPASPRPARNMDHDNSPTSAPTSPIVSTSTFQSHFSSNNGSGSAGPSRRLKPTRSVSLGIKLKLKKSLEFVKSAGKSSSPSSPSTSSMIRRPIAGNISGAELVRRDEVKVRRATSVESIAAAAAFAAPNVTKKGVLVRSYTTPAIVTLTRGDADSDMDVNFEEEVKVEEKTPRDAFDELLPIEVRLAVFGKLVQSFVNDLEKMKDEGVWSSAKASQTPWVGWEGGIRELVKISRVRTFLFLSALCICTSRGTTNLF